MQFFFFGMWSVIYAYSPELFPTRARATGCGTASGWGGWARLSARPSYRLIISSYGVEAVFNARRHLLRHRSANVLLLGPRRRGASLKR